MSVILSQSNIKIYTAPAGIYGLPSVARIGTFGEIAPILWRDSSGYGVRFEKVEVEANDFEISFYRELPTTIVEKTNEVIDRVRNYCYPPPFGFAKSALMSTAQFVSLRGVPIFAAIVLPPKQPNQENNFVEFLIYDLNIWLRFYPVGGSALEVTYNEVGRTINYFVTKAEVNDVAEDGALIFTLELGYYVLRVDATQVVAVLSLRVGKGEKVNVVIPLQGQVDMPQGEIAIRFYGAGRFWVSKYHNYDLTISPFISYIPQVVEPHVFIVQDNFGSLLYHVDTLPRPSCEFVPRVIRRAILYGAPAFNVSGTWTLRSGITQINWDNERGTLHTKNIDGFVVGGGLKIVVDDSYAWQFRITRIRQIQSGENLAPTYEVEFVNPLLQPERCLPIKFNPYLLSLNDVITIMRSCIYTVFNLVLPSSINLNTVLFVNDERELNAPTDWFDFIKELLNENAEYTIIGNTVIFQTLAEAITIQLHDDDFIISHEVEISDDLPTVALFAGRVVIGNSVTQRGIVISNTKLPMKRRERYEIAGFLYIGENAVVRLPTNEIAFVESVNYRCNINEIPTTELTVGVIDL